MTDQGRPADASGPVSSPPRQCRGRGRAAVFLVLVALSAGIVGGLVTKAFSQGRGPWPAAFMGGPVDATNVDQRVERMIKHLAIEVDATPDQQAKLTAIAQGAARDLLPLRDKAQANRKRALELFTAQNIDRAAIEQLRAEQIGLADTATKRISQALTEAADVLTVDQRKLITDRIESGPWGRWHRG